MGIRILAIAPDGLPQLDDRLGEASLSRKGQFKVDPRGGVRGVESEGFLVLDGGFVLPSLEHECPTEGSVCVRVPGPQLYGLGQLVDRPVNLPF